MVIKPDPKRTKDDDGLSPVPGTDSLKRKSISPAPIGAAPVGSALPTRPVTTSGSIPPPSLEALEERYSNLAEPDEAFSAEEAIDRQISALEDWSRANVYRERMELTRFWVLRGTAFAGAIISGMASYLPSPHPLLALAAGSLTVVALAIDAAWPPVSDRVTRRRATRELRELQQTLKLRWDKVRLAHPEKYSPKRIAHALAMLDAAQAKREEIGKYLSDSSPRVRDGVGGR